MSDFIPYELRVLYWIQISILNFDVNLNFVRHLRLENMFYRILCNFKKHNLWTEVICDLCRNGLTT